MQISNKCLPGGTVCTAIPIFKWLSPAPQLPWQLTFNFGTAENTVSFWCGWTKCLNNGEKISIVSSITDTEIRQIQAKEFVGICCTTLLCTKEKYRPARRRLDQQIYALLFAPHVSTIAASGSVLWKLRMGSKGNRLKGLSWASLKPKPERDSRAR